VILRSPEETSKLLAYNRWANARMLEPAGAVSLAEWDREVGGSFGSLHATLAHTYGAEWVWLERSRGVSPPSLPGPDDVPTPAALLEKWKALEVELAAFSRGLTGERLASPVTYANFQGETWTYTLADILFDLVNHSTYHRGQVATLLRQLGKTPVATDYVRFLDDGLAEPERSPEEIARLFAFNRWANARMLASVASVSKDDYARPVGGSFTTLRDTLAHLYGADWVWLERFGGRSPRELPAGQQAPTPEALRDKWERIEEGWAALANRAEAGRMREKLAYRNFKGDDLSYRIGEVLVHVVNHSTYHRGQVATLMRQLGATPASTEYLMMLDEGA
jgi:uncharacterized damage-inducible protein DinB